MGTPKLSLKPRLRVFPEHNCTLHARSAGLDAPWTVTDKSGPDFVDDTVRDPASPFDTPEKVHLHGNTVNSRCDGAGTIPSYPGLQREPMPACPRRLDSPSTPLQDCPSIEKKASGAYGCAQPSVSAS